MRYDRTRAKHVAPFAKSEKIEVVENTPIRIESALTTVRASSSICYLPNIAQADPSRFHDLSLQVPNIALGNPDKGEVSGSSERSPFLNGSNLTVNPVSTPNQSKLLI